MKRLLFIACLVPVLARGQDQVSLFGYFESQWMGAAIGRQFFQLQSNKVRLDLDGRINEAVTFGANVNAVTYHGKTSWPVLDLLPASVRDEAAVLSLPGFEVDPYVLPFQNRSYLDNAFVRLAFSDMDVTIGKQQLSFGTGYAWNPVDLFNTKDVMDPAYEQPGRNGIRLDWSLSGGALFTAVYGTGSDWEHSAKLMQLKIRVRRFDWALLAAETARHIHDYTQIDMDLTAPGFLQLTEKRRMLALNFAGEALGLGIWGEAAYHRLASRVDYRDLLIGLDYTFDEGSYVMAEYFYSGLGKADKRDYKLNDWMRFFAAEQKAMARQQVYAMVLFPVTDMMKIGFSSIIVPTDGSAALLPTFTWSAMQNVELTAWGNLYFGDDKAAYHPGLGSGGMVRARVYF